MSITAYTGVPGSGKSYALVEQVILPAIVKGRRVVTNIAGLDPQKVADYCEGKGKSDAGEVVLFEGSRALEGDFFPTESKQDGTFVRPGDLLVFDEWRLTFPKRGALPNKDLEPFLRYHRHLVNEKGVACDVAIGTQLVTDIHMDFRGLVERSYKFRKLKALGLNKVFAWDAFEGHQQAKGTAYKSSNGRYKPEIFPLYKSYATEGDGEEVETDKRTSIFGKSFMIVGVLLVGLFALSGWGMWHFFNPDLPEPVPVAGVQPVAGVPGAVQVPAGSSFRIVGMIQADMGRIVVLADESGTTKFAPAGDFEFMGNRPIRGTFEGLPVISEDRPAIVDPAMQL